MAYPNKLWQAQNLVLPSGTTIAANGDLGGTVLAVAGHDELLVLITYSGNTGSFNVHVDAVDCYGNTYQLDSTVAQTTASGTFVLNIGKGQTINTSFGKAVHLRFTTTTAGVTVSGEVIAK